MHGHRALRHVLDSVVSEKDGAAAVDLYLDFDWSGEGLAFAARHRSVSPRESRFTVDVIEAAGAPLAFRKPSWVSAVGAKVGGERVAVEEAEGYLKVEGLQAGDRLELALQHQTWIETREGRRVALGDLDEEVEGLLFMGPWLYGVDDGLEPLFFGEPWKGANVVRLSRELGSPHSAAATGPFTHPSRHVAARYVHGGFPGEQPLTLRPIAEQTGGAPGTVATWIRYRT
jgi:hypothetical protein